MAGLMSRLRAARGGDGPSGAQLHSEAGRAALFDTALSKLYKTIDQVREALRLIVLLQNFAARVHARHGATFAADSA